MSKIVHVVGNGDQAIRYKPAKGIKLTCNLPPFAVDNVYATCMVDFKMMKAITEGSVTVPGEWILGFRPKKWTEMRPDFYMKHAPQIKQFYLVVPKYAYDPQQPDNIGVAYTNFNCGHFAVHYSCAHLKSNEVHMYGFDSLFDPNMRSYTDTFLNSDRGDTNNFRLTNTWRRVWKGIFDEFPQTKFVLHHKHDKIKISVKENVEIYTGKVLYSAS